ncbi:MAG: DMT family transporter [Actinomycetota bacterium]
MATPTRTDTSIWPAAAAMASVMLWASTFPVYKILFRRIDPVAFVGAHYLMLIAAVFAYLAAIRRRLTLRGRDLRFVILAGFLGYACLELFFVLGLDRTTAIASAILIATHPIWGMTFAAIGARRRPALHEIVGFALGVGGVVVFLGTGGLGGASLGDLLSLAAAITFGAYAAMIERMGERVPQGELVATSLASGGLILVLVSLPAMASQDWSIVRLADWLLVVYTSFGPILLGFVLWAYALNRRGMARTAPFGYLEPLFATSLAVALLGESFASRQLLGGALVLAGVILATRWRVEPATPPAL